MMADWARLGAAAAGAASEFAALLEHPGKAQRRLLARILAANQTSAFGREHDFAAIDGFETYCERVALRAPDAFAPAIAKIAAGEVGVLTTAPVIAFEETGGSGQAAKLVPYTAAGLAGFRRAVLPWLGALIARRPAMTAGRAYVTISPATRQARATPGGLPIGLDTDAAYLGEDLAPAFAALLAVSPGVGRIADPGEWQVETLAQLVGADDLSFVSLWSPTFLLALLGALEQRAEAVLARLERPARTRLEQALGGPGPVAASLWSRLDCISCWQDGASAGYAAQLAVLFPQAAIEGKGLLATEAAVTLPWEAAGGCVPALASSVIEFHDSAGNVWLCDGLREGESYRIALTTESGLYRYDLGDRVRCTGHLPGGAPLLDFIGRDGIASDLVGEKFDDAQVAAALAGLDGPALLVARTGPPGYVLIAAPEAASDARDRVEAALARNPHYAHARRMEQLTPLEIVRRPQLAAEIVRRGLARGRRLGDLKPVALVPPGPAAEDWLKL